MTIGGCSETSTDSRGCPLEGRAPRRFGTCSGANRPARRLLQCCRAASGGSRSTTDQPRQGSVWASVRECHPRRAWTPCVPSPEAGGVVAAEQRAAALVGGDVGELRRMMHPQMAGQLASAPSSTVRRTSLVTRTAPCPESPATRDAGRLRVRKDRGSDRCIPPGWCEVGLTLLIRATGVFAVHPPPIATIGLVCFAAASCARRASPRPERNGARVGQRIRLARTPE